MSDEADLTGLDELPHDARAAIDAAERAMAEVHDRAERRSRAIRDAVNLEIELARGRGEVELAAVQQDATRELAPLVRGLLDRLRELQRHYAREGLLDEALAIRARVRQMRGDLLGVRPDPGTMTEFTTADVGRTALFDVVGRTDGSIWGTDVYTADSRLAVAAVHAGAVRDGERGLVRVTVVDGSEQAFVGTARNGVASFDYATYPVGYRVEKA